MADLHYAEDCIRQIKEMGFENFFNWGIRHGDIPSIEAGVYGLFHDLSQIEKYEDCAFLKSEFEKYKGRMYN